MQICNYNNEIAYKIYVGEEIKAANGINVPSIKDDILQDAVISKHKETSKPKCLHEDIITKVGPRVNMNRFFDYWGKNSISYLKRALEKLGEIHKKINREQELLLALSDYFHDFQKADDAFAIFSLHDYSFEQD